MSARPAVRPAVRPKARSCVRSALRTLLWAHTIGPDGRIHLNGWTDQRAASLWLPDPDGVVREIPGGVPALVDPATGRTPRWDGANYWATDATGAPLPSYGNWALAHYPGATEEMFYSLSPTQWNNLVNATLNSAPDFDYGVVKLYGAIATTTNAAHNVRDTTGNAVLPSTNYAFWGIARAGTSNHITFRITFWSAGWTFDRNEDVVVDLSTGAVVSTAPGITSVSVTPLAGGAWLIVAEATTTATDAYARPGFTLTNSAQQNYFAGDGVSVMSYIGGCGKMKAPFTAIIPTSGASQTRDPVKLLNPALPSHDVEATVCVDIQYAVPNTAITNKQLFGFKPTASSPLYVGASGHIQGTDGTSYPGEYSSSWAANERIKAACHWGQGVFGISFKSATGGWKHGTEKPYDGAMNSDGAGSRLFYSLSEIAYLYGLELVNRNLGKAGIEQRWP